MAIIGIAGLHDASTRWVVTHDFAEWKDEIPWDVALFQCGGLVQPRAVRFLLALIAGVERPLA
jgi:hypothetical protein